MMNEVQQEEDRQEVGGKKREEQRKADDVQHSTPGSSSASASAAPVPVPPSRLHLLRHAADRWRRQRWTQLAHDTCMQAMMMMQRDGEYAEAARVCMSALACSRLMQMQQQQTLGGSTTATAGDHASTQGSTSDNHQPLAWSRLAAMVKRNKKNIAPSITPNAVASTPPSRHSPLVDYDFSFLDGSSMMRSDERSTHWSYVSNGSMASTPPLLQLLNVCGDSEREAAAATSGIGSSSTLAVEPARHTDTASIPSHLLQCCKSQRGVSDQGAKKIETLSGTNVSPAQLQHLLIHLLQDHLPAMRTEETTSSMPSAPQYDVAIVRGLRALAHRHPSLSSIFTPAAQRRAAESGGRTSAASTNSQARHQSHSHSHGRARNPFSTSGLRLMSPTITLLKPTLAGEQSSTSTNSDSLAVHSSSTLLPSAARSLPSGSYIESSLHPLFSFRPHSLTLYRKSHPLHGVIEVDIDARIHSPIQLDALSVIVGVERNEQVNDAAHQRAQRERMSIIVSPPLPHVSASATVGTADLNSTPDSFQPPTVSPSPEPFTSTATQKQDDALSSWETQLPIDDSVLEWTCAYRGVSLHPGLNRLILHIFHTAMHTQADPSTNDTQPSLSAIVDGDGLHHHTAVIYHSHADLERLHACFAPSHAVLHTGDAQQTKANGILGLNGSSSARLPPTALRPHHSIVSASVSLRDVLFSVGRLHLWSVDVPELNRQCSMRIITRRQRRKDLIKQARMEASQRNNASIAGAPAAEPVKAGVIDPHFPPGLPIPCALFKPFVFKPRLHLDILGVSDEDLVIGRRGAFHLPIQIRVGGGRSQARQQNERRDSEARNMDAHGDHDDGDGDYQPTAIDACVLRASTNTQLKLFGARSRMHNRRNSQESEILFPASPASTLSKPVYGLLIQGNKTEERTFSINIYTGEIALGRIPIGCRLLLLFPVHAPAHLSHLLSTRQIILPSSSMRSTPHTSRPSSRRSSRPSSPIHTDRQGINHIGETTDNETELGDMAMSNDIHSQRHTLHLDLACAPVLPADASVPSLPSFLFSTSTCLTFMECVQMRASMERLGRRWFLRLFIWNRCTFPLTVRDYALNLPTAFKVVHDTNEQLRGYILPPLVSADRASQLMSATTSALNRSSYAHDSSLMDSLSMPGAFAAALAASTPISSTSSNVYSLLFELMVDRDELQHEQQQQQQRSRHASPARPLSAAGSRRGSMTAEEQADEIELATSCASAPIGRFTLQLDSSTRQSRPSSDASTASWPAPPPSSPLSLTWPIDIAIMSGAQDLHLLLSFPSSAHMGALMPFTITIMYLSGAERRKRGRRSERRKEEKQTSGITTPETTASAASSSSAVPSLPPLSLLYRVNAPSHYWLLVGKSSGRFDLHPGASASFTMHLLPIASGSIPIPHIEIRQKGVKTGHAHGRTGSIPQMAAEKLHRQQMLLDAEVEHGQTNMPSSRVLSTSSSFSTTSSPHSAPFSTSASFAVGKTDECERDRECDGEYDLIPSERILRHFATDHLIDVYPPTTFNTPLVTV